GYDALSLRYVGRVLSYRRIARASFISYAVSHNLGFAWLTGGSVRYRLYSSWGLSALEVTKVVAFAGATFWLGFLAVGGLSFLLQPLPIPEGLHAPFATARPLGLICPGLPALYLGPSALRPPPLRRRR